MKYKIVPSPIAAQNLVIELSASKSISNRVLIIRQLMQENFEIHQLSSSKDTQTLAQILNELNSSKKKSFSFDVGPAGTTMRFLTAYLACTDGEFVLTGSDRMKKRPIAVLVEALNKIGASIEYLEESNFPPLKINGKKIKGGTVELDAGISSQFVSALLLIAPKLENGLRIIFTAKPVSFSYIKMTLKLLKEFNVSYELNDTSVYVPHSNFIPKEFTVESDWSSASYWYSYVALSDSSSVFLKGLNKNSLQGDSVLPKIYKLLGVDSVFLDDGVQIKKIKNSVLPEKLIYDFENCPDIAQTVVVSCCALKIPFEFSGLQTLNLKETKRIDALVNEISKIGIQLKSNSNSHISGDRFPTEFPNNVTIKTYDDHRMAMSFAPLSLYVEGLTIENPQVVEKSYPEFWDHFRKAGFGLTKINQ